MKRIMVSMMMVLGLFTVTTKAQAASVVFDVPSASVVDANGWTSTLYVNGTPFVLTHTCALVATVVTCTATLPNITSALVTGSAQTFEVDLFDSVLNIRSAKSIPFIRNRPSVPTNGRFQ